jgi:hypothetical protein
MLRSERFPLASPNASDPIRSENRSVMTLCHEGSKPHLNQRLN